MILQSLEQLIIIAKFGRLIMGNSGSTPNLHHKLERRSLSSSKNQLASPQRRSISSGKDRKKKPEQLKLNGLSKADIYLYYFKQQANYNLQDHQYYPNIVMYYQHLNTAQEGPNRFTAIQNKITWIQKKIEEQRRKGETDNLRVYYGLIGELCWRNDQFKRSIAYLEQGLKICIKLYPRESIQSAYFYSNIGLNYDKLKQYSLAEQNLKIALEIYQAKGQESRQVAVAYNNIGNLLKRRKEYQEAIKYFHQSLEIKIKVQGEESQGVAATLGNLALLQSERKNYLQAIKNYKQSLTIYRSLFGPTHFQVSRSLFNLCLCYYNICQYGQWIDAHYESLNILAELKMTQYSCYKRRKNALKVYLVQLVKKSQCSKDIILKAIKITASIFKNDSEKDKQPFNILLQKAKFYDLDYFKI